jgi:hypothetical protein
MDTKEGSQFSTGIAAGGDATIGITPYGMTVNLSLNLSIKLVYTPQK